MCLVRPCPPGSCWGWRWCWWLSSPPAVSPLCCRETDPQWQVGRDQKMGREGRKSTPNKQKVCFGEEARGTRQHRGGVVGWEKEDRSKHSAPGAGCSCRVFCARWSSWCRAWEGELWERGLVMALMNRHSHLGPSVNGSCSCCWFLLERLVTGIA